MERYQLEKAIWGEGDFTEMGWHDVTVWSMLAAPETYEFVFDLDYIFKWLNPAEGETYFRFWVAPATMVFENVNDVKINIESPQGSIEIFDLKCGDPISTPNGLCTQQTYRFECQEGEVSLQATGFKMYVRRPPVLISRQKLNINDRGGISFEREVKQAPME